MSGPFALAAVSAVLRRLLTNGIGDVDLSIFGGAASVITLHPPDLVETGANELAQLNLYLYRVAPNAALRNEGLAARSATGERLSNPPLALPGDPREFPDVISQALSELRLAGVDGPYSVLLSADAYTKVSETTEHGYPIREHLNRLVDGEIIWAPAIDGAFVLSTRGGDFDLQLGTDVSIGYLQHDAENVQLYLEETLTFLCYTAEASVALTA